MIGRWFTPTTSKSKLRKSTSRICDSVNCAPVTSWHSPTVFTDVSRVTARHSVVIGFVMLSIHASGQISSMSRAMPTSTGMLRSARMIPPGPTVSPTDCLMPCRSGISRSWRMLSNAPVEMHDHDVVGALERVAPIGGGRHGDAGALRARRRGGRSRPSSGSGSGLMSWSTISASASDGVLTMSRNSFGTHW